MFFMFLNFFQNMPNNFEVSTNRQRHSNSLFIFLLLKKLLFIIRSFLSVVWHTPHTDVFQPYDFFLLLILTGNHLDTQLACWCWRGKNGQVSFSHRFLMRFFLVRREKSSGWFGLKRLHQKELPSRPVVLSIHGLDALSLSQPKIAGTTADKNWRE